MHKTIEEGKEFVETLAPLIGMSQVKVCLAVPFTSIFVLSQLKSSIIIGAQNVSEEEEGAFTGEISGKMLRDAGAKFVLVGHSERRLLFHEDSSLVNQKIKLALKVGLQPVLCIGETEEERAKGMMKNVLEDQLTRSLEGISEKDLSKMILAYEPVWAIGTGKTATPENAQEAHSFCRSVIEKLWSKGVASSLVIQYGGSVKEENACALMEMSDVDGLLIGGASLSPITLSNIIKCVSL